MFIGEFMKFKNKPNVCYETTCGKAIYQVRATVVVVSLNAYIESTDDSLMLVTKRGKSVLLESGKWCLPGGYLDFNEDLPQAAIRELWEESGIDYNSLKKENILLPMINWKITSNPKQDKAQNICVHFGACISVPDVSHLPKVTNVNCEPNEVDAVEWVSGKKFKKLDMAFEHKNVVEEFALFVSSLN